eukprot:Nk52_evm15s152 gene=Nk52_evmTU15s152
MSRRGGFNRHFQNNNPAAGTNLFPPHVEAMFTPRPALKFEPPLQREPFEKTLPAYTGVAAYVDLARTDPGLGAARKTHRGGWILSVREKREERAAAKAEAVKKDLEGKMAEYDPAKYEKVTQDPFKTIFVGRISYEATEEDLKREFEEFGPVESVYLIGKRSEEEIEKMREAYRQQGRKIRGEEGSDDKNEEGYESNAKRRRLNNHSHKTDSADGKTKKKNKKNQVPPVTLKRHSGFAFIEFQKESDMRAAYKHGDGRKICQRRVVVDVERGRTVKGFKPRRLGGGLGLTRRGGAKENVHTSGRMGSSSSHNKTSSSSSLTGGDRWGGRIGGGGGGGGGRRSDYNNYQHRDNYSSSSSRGYRDRDYYSNRDDSHRGGSRRDRDNRERDRDRDRGRDRDRDRDRDGRHHRDRDYHRGGRRDSNSRDYDYDRPRRDSYSSRGGGDRFRQDYDAAPDGYRDRDHRKGKGSSSGGGARDNYNKRPREY